MTAHHSQEVRRLGTGPSAVRADLVVPSDPTGWLVVGRGSQPVDRTVAQLAHAGVGSLVVDLPSVSPAKLARWVELGAAHLREELAAGLPVGYLGAGTAAAPGWIAAVNGSAQLDGVMGWNARPGAAWDHLPSVRVPSLLVVDEGEAWARAVARATRWRLGVRPDVVTGAVPGDVSAFVDWYRDRLLHPPARRTVAVPKPAPAKRRLASAGVAAALAAAPAGAWAAAVAVASLPDFGAGSTLSASQIGGDNATFARAGGSGGTGDITGARLTAAQIGGDGKEIKGPHDDPPLVDGSGFRWNVNTNIGFPTSSSASGAVSEGAWPPGNPVMATTLNGGTINQTLGDAFDGYNALCLDVNNVGGQCNTANWAVYNQNGPGALDCSSRQVVLPNKTMGNLTVRRKVYVPTNDSFARWLNFFTNTAATPQTVRMQTSNNLGSDAGTRIVTTSDGDATPEVTDTWVTTFQNYSGTTSSDPRIGHVLQSANAVVPVSALSFVNGDDNPFWRYVFTLQPGETVIIANFATGQPSKAAAATKSAELASKANANMFNCMTANEISQVRNFQSKASPTISTQASPGGAPGTSVTDTATVSGGNNPTGDVTFRLFSNDTCSSQVFSSTNALSGGTATSTPFAPAAAGTYYWTAVYNGDALNNTATSPCQAANESVVIGLPTPTISTQASTGGPLGTALTDTATVSGGNNPTGNVTFRLFTNDICSSQVFTTTNALSGGTATSSPFTPTAAGTYYWTAVYNGDANNNPATSPCNAPNESVTITKASPTIATQASPGGPLGTALTDTATVSGGASPTGNVTFRLFTNDTCSSQVFSTTNSLSGGTATSGSFAPAAAGTYYWTAVYNGDANNNPATSPCNAANESATIGFQPPPFTQTFTGTVNGPVVVNAGQSVLVTNARINGPITVNPGGALTVENSQVTNGIVANSPSFFSLCGSQVAAPAGNPAQGVVVTNAPVQIRIGDPANGCAFNRIAGEVHLTGNQGGLTLGGNVVSRSTSVDNNAGAVVVKGNTLGSGTLACSGNNPPPTNAGQPNTAPSKTGQCAAL